MVGNWLVTHVQLDPWFNWLIVGKEHPFTNWDAGPIMVTSGDGSTCWDIVNLVKPCLDSQIFSDFQWFLGVHHRTTRISDHTHHPPLILGPDFGIQPIFCGHNCDLPVLRFSQEFSTLHRGGSLVLWIVRFCSPALQTLRFNWDEDLWNGSPRA